jgi:hypothetical protein
MLRSNIVVGSTCSVATLTLLLLSILLVLRVQRVVEGRDVSDVGHSDQLVHRVVERRGQVAQAAAEAVAVVPGVDAVVVNTAVGGVVRGEHAGGSVRVVPVRSGHHACGGGVRAEGQAGGAVRKHRVTGGVGLRGAPVGAREERHGGGLRAHAGGGILRGGVGAVVGPLVAVALEGGRARVEHAAGAEERSLCAAGVLSVGRAEQRAGVEVAGGAMLRDDRLRATALTALQGLAVAHRRGGRRHLHPLQAAGQAVVAGSGAGAAAGDTEGVVLGEVRVLGRAETCLAALLRAHAALSTAERTVTCACKRSLVLPLLLGLLSLLSGAGHHELLLLLHLQLLRSVGNAAGHRGLVLLRLLCLQLLLQDHRRVPRGCVPGALRKLQVDRALRGSTASSVLGGSARHDRGAAGGTHAGGPDICTYGDRTGAEGSAAQGLRAGGHSEGELVEDVGEEHIQPGISLDVGLELGHFEQSHLRPNIEERLYCE